MWIKLRKLSLEGIEKDRKVRYNKSTILYEFPHLDRMRIEGCKSRSLQRRTGHFLEIKLQIGRKAVGEKYGIPNFLSAERAGV